MHAHSSSPLCPLAPYLQNRNEGVEWRQRWTCRRVERGMEENKFAERQRWTCRRVERGMEENKFAEKWKGKGRSTSSGSSKKRNKYASFIVCINFWRPSQPFTPPFISPFTPPSLRPRSPLTEKATKSMHFYIAWEAKCLSPPYAL